MENKHELDWSNSKVDNEIMMFSISSIFQIKEGTL